MKHIDINFGAGHTELFLKFEKGIPKVLDYEYDADEIHHLCGGRQYYTSRSGFSGAGWIESYRSLIPVGYYRTDVAYFEWIKPVEVADRIDVMLPYQAHTEKKDYNSNPVVVILRGEWSTECEYVVYTTIERIAEVVKTLQLGKIESLDEARELTKTFVDDWGHDVVMTFKFVNLFGGRSFNPWHFVARHLHNLVCEEHGGVWEAFDLTRLYENFYCRKVWLAGSYYRGERVEGLTDDAFYDGGEELAAFVPPNWEIINTVARRSTRNGQAYHALYWVNPGRYQEFIIPKIFMDTAESPDELKALMGFEVQEETDNDENFEENGDEE